MKPIKLRNLPKDPCEGCLVQPACTKTCIPKMKFADWIKSKYYGEHMDTNKGRLRKNARKMIQLYEKNKFHTKFFQLYKR